MKFTYIIIDFVIFFAPFILGVIFRFKQTKKVFRDFLFTFIIISPFFIIWDHFFTYSNYWGFNNEFVIGKYFLNLPIEELLFFFCIPFACIALYELVNLFIKDKSIRLNKYLIMTLMIFILLFVILSQFKIYFTLVSFLTLIILITGFNLKKSVFYKRNFWIFLLISFIPFLIVNSILTTLPVVIYNSNAIIGIRVFSIPLEDFVYSFFMLSVYLIFYNLIKNNVSK